MTQLGKYEIIEEIGRGGFGTVYKARDAGLDILRAIKILHPALIADQTFLARFKQEAQITAKLENPHLVPVYDFGEIDTRFYITLKYMPNGSLSDLLTKKGALSIDESIEILSDVASGLSFAHQKGIIHRDLKPDNILFDEDGHARISDLGFAKALHGSNSASLSNSGAMVGTPAYMAPEIWRGKSASQSTDIYSLGCILYEMLSGEVLFQGGSPADIMTKHVLERPNFKDRDWPEKVKAILLKSLAVKPEERFQTPEAFIKSLNQVESQSVKAVKKAPSIQTPPRKSDPSQSPRVKPATPEKARPKAQVDKETLKQEYIQLTDSIDQLMSTYQIAPLLTAGTLSAKLEARGDLLAQVNQPARAINDYRAALKISSEDSNTVNRLQKKLKAAERSGKKSPGKKVPVPTPTPQNGPVKVKKVYPPKVAPTESVRSNPPAGSQPTTPPVIVKSWEDRKESQQKKKRKSGKIILTFAAIGVAVTLLIILAVPQMNEINAFVINMGGMHLNQGLSGAALGLFIGFIQSLIFKHRLSPEKRILYILFAVFGGFSGGYITAQFGLWSDPFLFGGLSGLISGSLSSLLQNILMSSSGKQIRWMLFSILSWSAIWGIGWRISWSSNTFVTVAIGTGTMLLLSGFALAGFISISPDIEF